MAATFDHATTDVLRRTDLLGVAGYPWTVAGWVRPVIDVSADRVLFARYEDGNLAVHQTVRLTNGAGQLRITRNTTTMLTGGAVTDGAWNHVAAIITSNGDTDNHRVYVNGAKTTATVATATGAVNRTELGGLGGTIGLIGDLYGWGLWNAVLTDDEVAGLAAGFQPPQVRPQSLVAYWPLSRGHVTDSPQVFLDRWANGYHLTDVNDSVFPVDAPNPRIYAPMVE